jgi:FlaA1/EpsC-like NDP-sugar epimerase
MIQRLMSYRRLVVFLIHLLLVVISSYLALWLRFDGNIPADTVRLWLNVLPALLFIRLVIFFPLKLYEGLWRYTSLIDLRDIVLGVLASSVAFFSVVYVAFGITSYPRSVYLIDALLLISFMSGTRLLRRVVREFHHLEKGRRVLVYGAGDAGEMIVRDMKHNPWYALEPIAFVDDNRTKVGQRIHGVPVMGTREKLAAIIARERPDEVLIAMPKADTATMRAVVRALEPFKIPIKTLPNLRDILDGTVKVSQIRNLSIEDLLPRAPVGLDPEPVRALVQGRTVMVTGAGGSIGSELCRQIAALKPKALLLFERYENSLFAVANELADRNPGAPIWPIIGDVADYNRVSAVMAAHRPDMVFHAAAHKHVPLMELNPCEAVKNNVAGTWVLAQVAGRYDVGRVVLISTDKAVNPTSVMGATKRVAELIVQAMAGSSNGSTTRFTAVRFGNVLGSNGSVVPRFLEQIHAGGPVTVTHPEMKRYFMLIPEAVQLVLHAAALAEGGEVFVLDMGEQIKVLDLARNLIRLSGFVPEEDIPIRFIGLRPGEKLYEELVGSTEVAERLPIEKIFRIRRQAAPDMGHIEESVQKLHRVAVHGDVAAVMQNLRALIPTFNPNVIASGEASVRASLPALEPTLEPLSLSLPLNASTLPAS